MGHGEHDHPTGQLDSDDQFHRAVERKTRRKIAARSSTQRGVWFWLGMFGLVGWSVMIPTLAGVALGVWLQSRWPNTIPWILIGVLSGVTGGCLTAWYWMRRESRGRNEQQRPAERHNGARDE